MLPKLPKLVLLNQMNKKDFGLTKKSFRDSDVVVQKSTEFSLTKSVAM